MQNLSRLSFKAEEHGYIVVYPDGIDRNWNDGRKIDDHRQKQVLFQRSPFHRVGDAPVIQQPEMQVKQRKIVLPAKNVTKLAGVGVKGRQVVFEQNRLLPEEVRQLA